LVHHQRALILGLLGLIVVSNLSVAIWVIPREDRKEAFTPNTEQIRALQANGHRVVLFTPSERLAGAGVFYSQTLLVALQSEDQLNSFLAESRTNVAVMERQTDPVAPLK
ncbi:dolichyl-phosphate-mannose--protein mannosyltransferase, partial [Pseudomonas sp. RTS4]|nr:dolichyl-phosphate-mannose--protein mannosyltransferase [Pseudomonas sp. RTS4]